MSINVTELRWRARTDLFFLAHSVLGHDKMVERVHRPVCEFFAHKDPNKPLEEQESIHERLLLDPRGHFKTTLDVADIVQWILCFPDIRILIMTGTRELATRMMLEVQNAFQNNERMRTLFPEFCVDSRAKLPAEEFTSPARKKFYREPTVAISTIDSVKAGSHYDVIKCDDLVHENNIGTAEQLEKTTVAYNYVLKLLEPFGYIDVIGTRYDYSDHYGWMIDRIGEERLKQKRVEIPFGWYYEGSIDPPEEVGEDEERLIKVFCRQCWIPQQDGKHLLLFPERMRLGWLKGQQRDNPYLFSCQYLNDPTIGERKTFTEDLLLSHTIPHAHIPRIGRVFQTWDLGFSQKSFADFSVCATGLFDGTGRLFILDLDVGRYSPHELAMQILVNYLKWRPSRVGIEEAAGSPLLAPALEMLAAKHHVLLPVDWIKVRMTKGAKEERIGSLHPLLEHHQLFFSAAIPQQHVEELKKQFIRFPRYKHDDIPDAISLLLNYRDMVDVEINDFTNPVEIVGAQVVPGCEGLGAGLVG